MSESKPTLSRRTALAGALAAGGAALATLPTTLLGHPDAALFALQADLEAADREMDAAHADWCAAEEEFVAAVPAMPKRPEFYEHFAEEGIDLLGSDDWRKADPDRIRACADELAVRLKAHDVELAAWKDWRAQLRARSRIPAADERIDQRDAVVSAIRDKIAGLPATTLAGLKMKARYAIRHPDELDAQIMASIVHDLLAMSAGGQDG
jgi:hypothetical protein